MIRIITESIPNSEYDDNYYAQCIAVFIFSISLPWKPFVHVSTFSNAFTHTIMNILNPEHMAELTLLVLLLLLLLLWHNEQYKISWINNLCKQKMHRTVNSVQCTLNDNLLCLHWSASRSALFLSLSYLLSGFSTYPSAECIPFAHKW